MKKIRTNVRSGSLTLNRNAKLSAKRLRGGVRIQSGTRAGKHISGVKY
jgi:hypothetical protein